MAQELHDLLASGTETIAVGEQGIVFRRGGEQWNVDTTPDGIACLHGISASPSSFFAVRAAGTILRRSR